MSKQYYSIDLMKFIFCLCIIGIHTNISSIFPQALQLLIGRGLFRLAVPFFFVCSGFWIGKKYSKQPTELDLIIKNYIFRLLIPLVVFESINNLLEIIKQLLRQTPSLTICHDIMKHILFYPYGALWYVQASIIAIIIIYPFLKKERIQIILIISIFLYAFALLCNNYYFLIKNSYLQIIVDSYMQLFISARNGIFVGTCFLILGIYVGIHIESPKIHQYAKPLLFISIILYFLELLVVNQQVPLDDGALFISHLFLAPLLLIMLTKSSLHLKYAKYLRNLSTGMYFLHRILISIIDILSFITGKILPVTVLFFIVVLMSILICAYSYTVKNQFFNQLLR